MGRKCYVPNCKSGYNSHVKNGKNGKNGKIRTTEVENVQ